MSRPTFSSSLTTILTMVGVTVGLGNVWRFPYMMGSYGGSAFLFVYVAFVFLFGIPAVMGEWALGRETRRGPLGALTASLGATGRWFGRGLLVVPGTDDAIVFRTAPSDATTLSELGLQSQRPALAGSFGGEHAGPPATLERVTIFGRTHVRICTLASEVIFTGTIVAQRRQQGCVRFSYVAPGSRTPRRYRCQPDLALEARALKKGLASTDDLSETDRRLVENQMRPDFTSEHYGDPGYAQLSLTTACEIRTGAEDGSEMGVFSLLKQPQREANLRIRLEEYLPFGLEAGFIFVT